MSIHSSQVRVDPFQEKRHMFIQVYEKYRPAIFNYIFYRVGDTQLADDLTSDVFVKLVDKYDEQSRQGRPLGPWLYAIARNLVIDHQRRAGRIGWRPLDEQTPADEASNPSQQIETRLTRDCLIRAMDHLTEDQRQVVLLKFIEKRTNREIGDLLEKPEGAIKALQHRALAGLRRALEKEPCYEA
jgi:RNA polymerase sigma-70 factor (ECF subfamily)